MRGSPMAPNLHTLDRSTIAMADDDADASARIQVSWSEVPFPYYQVLYPVIYNILVATVHCDCTAREW